MIKLVQPVRGILKDLPNGIIAQRFGVDPANYSTWGLKGHNGLDLATFFKDTIMAAHNGTIISVELDPYHTLGKNVWLVSNKQPDGRYTCTVYAHMENVNVKIGDKIKTGDKIGEMGNTGNVRSLRGEGGFTGIHLHFGVYEYINPQPNTYQKSYPSGNSYSVLSFNNGFKGALNPCDFLGCDNIDMLKIIGDNKTKRQYLLGNDGLYTWIYNETLLNWIHNSGIADKFQVEWKDIDISKIKETIALIK